MICGSCEKKANEKFAPQADGGISIKDESLCIDWKIPTENALLSEMDMKHELLKDFDSPFIIEVDLYPEIRLEFGISGI